jgi:hypothetical protein
MGGKWTDLATPPGQLSRRYRHAQLHQTLYINGEGLLKRHDYDVEIAGGTPGAHYIEGYEEVSGIMFPTKRRIFPRQADGTSSPEPLVVSIDLSDIVLNHQ